MGRVRVSWIRRVTVLSFMDDKHMRIGKRVDAAAVVLAAAPVLGTAVFGTGAGVASADVPKAGAASGSVAKDWPQFRGPARDGVSKETGLLKQWPADGPP